MAAFQRQFQAVRRSFRRKKRDYDVVFECTPVVKRQKIGNFRPEISEELASMDVRSSIAQDGSRWDIIEDLDLFYFRQLAVSLQDYDMQQKIDLEIKMREGTRKLLVACKREAQSLEAAKNLLTSNVRVLSYMSELQRRKTAEFADRAASRKIKSAGSDSGVEAEAGGDVIEPCRATVCVSDLRIPLMWRGVDHIKNKGDHHRYAVFCLLKIDTQIYATQLVSNIDRTATDVNFKDVIVFDNVKPDFTCILEVYSYNLHNDMTIASTPQKIRRKLSALSASVGRRGSLGHKTQVNSTSGSTEEEQNEGPRYSLVARARLRLQQVSDQVQTFDLNTENDDNTAHQLQLFGNICCRLAAQPLCTVEESMSGYLSSQDEFQGKPVSNRLWCRLQGSHLICWDDPTEGNLGEPSMTLQLRKNSSAVRSTCCTDPLSFVIGGCGDDPDRKRPFTAESEEELEMWLKGFEQQLINIETWSDCCHQKMKIYSPFPGRSDLVLAERKGSLYDECSLVSPEREEFNDENVFQGPPSDNLRSRRKMRSQSMAAAPSTSSSSSTSSLSSSPLLPWKRPVVLPAAESSPSSSSPSTSSAISSSTQSPPLFPFDKTVLQKETTV
ncbi:rhotekin isoform X1 [Strongylocentrotus purpuratus]|uniref:PH domain-containing protein n=2 Tax=Strongylocentrotus purpuratus TaxID=7668 RepID=A0A7M7RGW5_STRPU|nr:rhotekin isoform X1 [Strongylocentrotus purpuratus]|eukprot:XP_786885.3 PREDICTED: rhotekin isoform X1 [Strongylocentrotus purpuratus]